MYYTTGSLVVRLKICACCFGDLAVYFCVGASCVSANLGFELLGSVVVTLTYLRRNRVQCELAETYGVSQSTLAIHSDLAGVCV